MSSTTSRNPLQKLLQLGLVPQIMLGILLGIAVALVSPDFAKQLSLLGVVFVKALKSIAPLLVFVLVSSAIANRQASNSGSMKPVLMMYLVGTFLAAVVAVALSFLFPTTLILNAEPGSISAPEGISQVLMSLLLQVVDNPISALMNANYIGVLAWAIGLGLALQHASDTTKEMVSDISNGVSSLVKFIIRLAPLGILGLVADAIATTGFSSLASYGKLIAVLLSAMLIIALVVNPVLVFFKTRKNPYPLVLTCLRESGVTAFFTRSSAANIPVNLALSEKLGLNKELYSVSIPLGATINMAGAAITITVLTLATVNTLGIQVDLASAILLSIIATISACGASGVAGGSLLLIPLACSMFGIPNDVAMQVVAIGFVIGVIQDSAETALNSSTDVVFTAAVSRSE